MKEANLIIIGGTIAAGKSSLVEGLAKSHGFFPVPELREGDEIQDIILKKLYEGNRIHLATIQQYFLTNRVKQYEEHADALVTSILDRGIWEDWIFAKLLMKDELKSYEHYKVLWKAMLSELVEKYGKPKAYIFLKVDWETFKERIYERNRSAEVSNFSKNEEYFRDLLKEYNDNFVNILKEWDLRVIEIDTVQINKEQVLKTVEEKLKGICL